MTSETRSLSITAESIRAYSRRGNYHSDSDEARRIGLPGMLAQGIQVAGPAYAALLDLWGEDFLSHGELDLKFVGMVWEGQTVDARVDFDDGDATIEIVNATTNSIAVVGLAKLASPDA